MWSIKSLSLGKTTLQCVHRDFSSDVKFWEFMAMFNSFLAFFCLKFVVSWKRDLKCRDVWHTNKGFDLKTIKHFGQLYAWVNSQKLLFWSSILIFIIIDLLSNAFDATFELFRWDGILWACILWYRRAWWDLKFSLHTSQAHDFPESISNFKLQFLKFGWQVLISPLFCFLLEAVASFPFVSLRILFHALSLLLVVRLLRDRCLFSTFIPATPIFEKSWKI